jgi:hypothetical protein
MTVGCISASALRILAAALGFILAACSSIKTHTPDGQTWVMSEAEFSAYVEHVFRYHNQVVNSLIEASYAPEDSDRSGRTDLARAETRMLEACAPLNEVVSDSLSGRNSGLRAKLRLIDTAPACEGATRSVEALLR